MSPPARQLPVSGSIHNTSRSDRLVLNVTPSRLAGFYRQGLLPLFPNGLPARCGSWITPCQNQTSSRLLTLCKSSSALLLSPAMEKLSCLLYNSCESLTGQRRGTKTSDIRYWRARSCRLQMSPRTPPTALLAMKLANSHFPHARPRFTQNLWDTVSLSQPHAALRNYPRLRQARAQIVGYLLPHKEYYTPTYSRQRQLRRCAEIERSRRHGRPRADRQFWQSGSQLKHALR